MILALWLYTLYAKIIPAPEGQHPKHFGSLPTETHTKNTKKQLTNELKQVCLKED